MEKITDEVKLDPYVISKRILQTLKNSKIITKLQLEF